MIVDLGLGGVKIFSQAPVGATLGGTMTITYNPGGMGQVAGQKLRIIRVAEENGRHEVCGEFPQLEPHNKRLLESYFNFCKTWAD